MLGSKEKTLKFKKQDKAEERKALRNAAFGVCFSTLAIGFYTRTGAGAKD